METSTKFSNLLLVFILVLLGNASVQSATLDQNGYTLNIAISNQVDRIPEEERASFLQTLQDTMTGASQLLFQVTDYRFYFKTVNILLPRSWTGLTTSVSPKLTFANADIRIEETKDGNDEGNLINTWVQTKNSKPCGIPGEYILILPDFFTDTTNKYGDKAKVMVHEFAHLRYGVFEEYGYADEREDYEDLFPYAYTSPFGYQKVTLCNNTEIEGKISTLSGTDCKIPDNPDCRFRPDMNAATGPTSSLMSMHFIPSANSFCDSTNHDRTAPNKQNYWCHNRSIKTVISKTPDFTSTSSTLPPSTNTTPAFNYYTPAPQAVYIVFDTSNHNPSTAAAFNDAKTQISNFLTEIQNANSRTFVGVAEMSGQTTNLGNNRLGGYLNEIQPLIQIQGNVQGIAQRINSLTRSTAGLLLEPAVLDIGDNLSPFSYQSGSLVLLVKLSDSTATSMNVESEAIQLLNSRNIRLMTVEIGDGRQVLERTTLLTGGSYFSGTSANYGSAITEALGAIRGIIANGAAFANLRVQLVRSSFTASTTAPATGYAWLDFSGSGAELNFFIPIGVNGVTIQVKNPSNADFTAVRQYTSWDGRYDVYSVSVPTSPAGNWRFSISTAVINPLSGFVDIVEILPDPKNVNIGGGGPTSQKPVEVEVYTSGIDGVLDMSQSPEDFSFLVYASVKKGVAIANPGSPSAVRAEATIRHASTGKVETIPMKDDGIYPDLLSRDGTFTGLYKPPVSRDADGIYNISVRLDRTTPPAPISLLSPSSDESENSMRHAMPVDQSEYCCGQTGGQDSISVSYMRMIPYAASLRVVDALFQTDRPSRIMDFRIESISADRNSATFTWTAPPSAFGSTTPVTSYRLVKSTSPNDIIDENGLVNSAATSVDADVTSGSLTPLAPGSAQSVTINLRREAGPQSPPLYFTIGSVFAGLRSYASLMKFTPVANIVVV